MEEGEIHEGADDGAEDDGEENGDGKGDVGLSRLALGADHGRDIVVNRGGLGGGDGGFRGEFFLVDGVARERALFDV